jgi:hypothetical protein
MFDAGGNKLFAQVAECAVVYGEYGCGESTKYIANNTKARIIAVDTSKEWADRTRSAINDRHNALICHVDCGPVGDWGRPLSMDFKDRFHSYHYFPWSINETSPNVVLIDGRFRVACFLATITRATPGTQVLFDDYCDRPQYHIVEQIVTPAATGGRMALFVRPEFVDNQRAQHLYDEYQWVLD